MRPWRLGTSSGQLDYPLEWKESVQVSPEFCTPESVLRAWRIGNGCSRGAHDSNASWRPHGLEWERLFFSCTLPRYWVRPDSCWHRALLLGSFLNTADSSFSYSINQSAKEVLYVPTSPDEKYKAWAFIDMFIQRFALAVGLTFSFKGFASIRWLSLATVLILDLWIAIARFAGRSGV